MNKRFNPVSLQQAAQDSPTLAALAARADDARRRLQAVADVIPAPLRGAVQAGPADGQNWCLLVHGSAAAAKLRQLLPAMQARLQAQGWPATSIRLKITGQR